MPDMSVRIYENLSEAKEAGRDWEKLLDKYCLDRSDRFIVDIENCNWVPTADKVRLWMELMGGGCRATYFNRKKVLMRHYKADTEND
jgi:hypothetical protein